MTSEVFSAFQTPPLPPSFTSSTVRHAPIPHQTIYNKPQEIDWKGGKEELLDGDGWFKPLISGFCTSQLLYHLQMYNFANFSMTNIFDFNHTLLN